MFNKPVSNKVDPQMRAVLTELEDLREIAKRIETRLCLFAHHMGATHIGAPLKPTKGEKRERHD